MSNINGQLYIDNGYKSRKDYLQSLSDENNVSIDVVLALSEVLGPEEDFDGLVNAVEDASNADLGLENVIENF